jgi:hypothetical protein
MFGDSQSRPGGIGLRPRRGEYCTSSDSILGDGGSGEYVVSDKSLADPKMLCLLNPGRFRRLGRCVSDN